MKVNKVLDIRHSHDCGHVHHQKFTIYVYIYFALALTVPKRTHKQTNTIKHIQQRPNRHTVCVCVRLQFLASNNSNNNNQKIWRVV